MSAELVQGGPATQAYAAIWNIYERYGALLATVNGIGVTNTPDDWVPWFIWDYGLEDVVPYVRDYRRVLAEGPEWQRTRGTDRGIEIGIGWVDSVGTVAPPDGRHNWWQFQVAFPEPPEGIAQIQQLAGIIRLSSAAEDELFRMFSPDYDHRPMRMDMHRADTGGRYDGYSGEPRWEGGPIISFGRDETGVIDLLPMVSGGAILEAFSFVEWWDGMRYDVDRDGERPRAIWEHGTETDGTRVIIDLDDAWPEAWPSAAWADLGGPEAIVLLAGRDVGTLEFLTSDDVWPDTYPLGGWAGTGSAPIPMEPT